VEEDPHPLESPDRPLRSADELVGEAGRFREPIEAGCYAVRVLGVRFDDQATCCQALIRVAPLAEPLCLGSANVSSRLGMPANEPALGAPDGRSVGDNAGVTGNACRTIAVSPQARRMRKQETGNRKRKAGKWGWAVALTGFESPVPCFLSSILFSAKALRPYERSSRTTRTTSRGRARISGSPVSTPARVSRAVATANASAYEIG